jgi:hypothetical protein
MSANIIAANGPGPIPANSMMRYPESGPAMPVIISTLRWPINMPCWTTFGP